MDGLFGQPARRILEDGNEMRRDVVSVEDGRARLERRGDAVLERHDNSSIKERVYEEKRVWWTMLAAKEREEQPQDLPQPGSAYCLSFLSSQKQTDKTQKRASLLVMKLLPAAARDPTSWKKEKRGMGTRCKESGSCWEVISINVLLQIAAGKTCQKQVQTGCNVT